MPTYILLAGAQATLFELSFSSAPTEPTMACVQTCQPEPLPIQTDNQHSLIPVLLVLGVILGLATISTYIMERLAANQNNY
jgi:hypothetical protein